MYRLVLCTLVYHKLLVEGYAPPHPGFLPNLPGPLPYPNRLYSPLVGPRAVNRPYRPDAPYDPVDPRAYDPRSYDPRTYDHRPPFVPLQNLPPRVQSPYYRQNINNIVNPEIGADVPIVSFSNLPSTGNGEYAYSFVTADGKEAQESGFLKDAFVDEKGEPQGIQVAQGSYSYISPDGTPIQVSYIADENGFRPSAIHIPSVGAPPPLAPPPPPPAAPLAPENLTRGYLERLNRYNPYAYQQPNPNIRPYDYYKDPYKYRNFESARVRKPNWGKESEAYGANKDTAKNSAS